MKQFVMILLLLAFPAIAQAELGIAAIVNDTVISTQDLNERVDLAMRTTGQPDSPELRAKAQEQLLEILIDESLRIQEAKRFSINVSDREIDEGVRAFEMQQGKPEGSLPDFIKSNGLSYDSFRRQIESQLAWRKFLSRKVRRDIVISDDEILRAQKRIARGKRIPEVQIASIILPMNDSNDPEALLGIARDIRSQLINGAEAAELIEQYKDRIALEFGPVTWIARDQLNPVIRRAIESIEEGEIAEPVQTPAGFQILRLLGTRTISTVPTENAEVALKQIILKLDNSSSDQEIDSKMEIARSIQKYPGSCTEAGIAGLQAFDGLNIEVNYIRTTMATMTPEIRLLVEPLPVTGITEPFASEDGIHMLMLCERITIPAPLPKKEQVQQILFDEKLQLESEKYLRQLRREAFIDIRV